MSTFIVERRRTGLDMVLGVLLILASFVILGHTVLATVVSVVFLGWVTLFSGLGALVAALFRVGKGGFWSTALSGGLLTVLGLLFLRNPAAAALGLTLAAGSLFLVSGITRLVAASRTTPTARRSCSAVSFPPSSVCWSCSTCWRPASRCWGCCSACRP